MSQKSQKFTPQQQAAITTRNVSLVLSAGAGCGKTFVLTQRFLSYLQQQDDDEISLSGIVAITFTDRASREMRNRIREACHQQLQACEHDVAPYWLSIIRQLDSARISTIHAFCSSLLRANAVDAKIDPRFSLMEEGLNSTLLRKSVTTGLHELLEAQNENCMFLVQHYGLEQTIENMQKLVKQNCDSDHRSITDLPQTELMEEWQTYWQTTHLPQMLQTLGSAEISKTVVRLLRKFKSSNKVMKERTALLIDRVPKLSEASDVEPIDRVNEILQAARVQGGGNKSTWDSDEAYDIVAELLKEYRKEINKVKKKMNCTEESFQTSTEIALLTAHVMEHLTDHYQQEKQKLGLLDFGDLLLLTRNLLRDNPAVRNRVAKGIDFLMVDEFQDTDPIQAEIVRMLCGGELLTGKLFLVGDAKQSIYRFRKADPKVFASLRNEIPKAGQLPLSINFRSQPDILNFVNCLFAHPFGKGYEPLLPFTKEPVSKKPNIEFLFAFGDPDAITGKEDAPLIRRREAKWIASRIQELLQDETPRIWDKESSTGQLILRRVKTGDIMILFRAMTNVTYYEEALRLAGIDYYLVGGRAFFAQQEVYDFINLCQWLDDIDDEVSLAGLLRSPWFGLTDDSLFALAQQGTTLHNGLKQTIPTYLPEDQQQQIQRAATVLEELRSKKDLLPLTQLLNLALKRTGYDASMLHEFLGRRKLANLRKLIEMARSFDSAGMQTLKDFVIQMRESVNQEEREEMAVTLPETGDVVRLMSVHKSKGLEFPVVFVADMDRPVKGNSSSVDCHPQWGPLVSLPKKQGVQEDNPGRMMFSAVEKREDEDEMNRLLYVATTRAADLLILSSGLPSTGKIQSFWMKLLTQQFDIQTGLPAVDPYLGTSTIKNLAPDEIPDIFIHREEPGQEFKGKTTSQRLLPLAECRATVNDTSAIALPDLLQQIPPNLAAIDHLSVSFLEDIDKKIQGDVSVTYASATESTDESNVNATKMGTLVHEVIERINFQSPLSPEELVSAQMSRSKLSGEELKAAAVARLLPFWESALFEEIRDARQCYREIDFRLQWKVKGDSTNRTITIVGQIDSLVQNASGLWKIIDFKTSRKTSKETDEQLKQYEIQMGLYSFACFELFGEYPDTVELVMLERNHVNPVLFVPTNEKMEELRTRIDRAIASLK